VLLPAKLAFVALLRRRRRRSQPSTRSRAKEGTRRGLGLSLLGAPLQELRSTNLEELEARPCRGARARARALVPLCCPCRRQWRWPRQKPRRRRRFACFACLALVWRAVASQRRSGGGGVGQVERWRGSRTRKLPSFPPPACRAEEGRIRPATRSRRACRGIARLGDIGLQLGSVVAFG